MRWLLLLAMLPLPAAGQYTLYTCMVTSKDYVVGAKLAPSGIFLKSAAGGWRHAGYNHPFVSAFDYDPADLKNGMVVQVAARSEYRDIEAFHRAILALPLEVHLTGAPSVRFRSLRGKLLEFTYGQTPRVNGTALDYAHWPLFGGPYVEAAVDSEQLILKYGKMRRTLDFRRLTVTDTQ